MQAIQQKKKKRIKGDWVVLGLNSYKKVKLLQVGYLIYRKIGQYKRNYN